MLNKSASIISIFFFTSGTPQFVFNDMFIEIMPSYLAYPKELVLIGGVFELLVRLGFYFLKHIRLLAKALIVLMIAVFPANINMALHPQNYTVLSELLLWIRLPIQFVIVWFVWFVWRII